MRIVDNHVHVGWFYDGYHSPKEVLKFAQMANVDEIVVSSTSICANQCLHKLIVREFKELQRLGKPIVHPVLWLRPDMFKKRFAYNLSYLLRYVKWEGVKFHYEAHPEWSKRSDLVEKGLELAEKLNVPVLFHTGSEKCNACVFEHYIEQHPTIAFILAHSSPPLEAKYLANQYPNVYLDTASICREHLLLLKNCDTVSRIIFGTDSALCSHEDGYKEHLKYILHKRDELLDVFGENEYNKIIQRCPYAKNTQDK